MHRVRTLEAFEDDHGNRIEFEGRVEDYIKIKFKGRNNVLRVAQPHHIAHLVIDFDCDNGLVEIGPSRGVAALRAGIRVGEGCTVSIGRNVSSTTPVSMSTAEG